MLVTSSRQLKSAWAISMYVLLASMVAFACSTFSMSVAYAYMAHAAAAVSVAVISFSLLVAALSVFALLCVFVAAAIVDR